MANKKVIEITEDFLPAIDELPGELAQLAKVIEGIAPGYGVRITVQLAEEYRSTHIYFHALDDLKRKKRDAWIIKRYNDGERVADIARDPNIQLSSRQVINILGREPGEEKQLKLF